MTLNGVIALSLRYLSNFIHLQADYVTVVEGRHNVRQISSPSYMWPKLTQAAVAESLCDS